MGIYSRIFYIWESRNKPLYLWPINFWQKQFDRKGEFSTNIHMQNEQRDELDPSHYIQKLIQNQRL